MTVRLPRKAVRLPRESLRAGRPEESRPPTNGATTEREAASTRQTDSPRPRLWSDGNRILGYPVLATASVPTGLTKGNGTSLTALVFANWRDLLVNLFSAVDIIVNPYLQCVDGVTRFTALQDVGVQLLTRQQI